MIVEEEIAGMGSDLSGERIVYAFLIVVFAVDCVMFVLHAKIGDCACVATTTCEVRNKVRSAWLFRWLLVPLRFDALFQLARSVWSAAPKLLLTTLCLFLVIGMFGISFFVLFSAEKTPEAWVLIFYRVRRSKHRV